MKIGTQLQFEVPDECPKDCYGKSVSFEQGGFCDRCPVFNCIKRNGFYILNPSQFRDDWAEEWEHFFLNGTKPELYL